MNRTNNIDRQLNFSGLCSSDYSIILSVSENYTQQYQYDELGNILQMQSASNWTRNYVYDTVTIRLLKHNPDQTTNDYTYDAHGNMLTMPHLSNMEWDEKDQLHSATNGTFTSFYNYDARGNRTRKVIDKGNITETRYYIGEYEVFRKENSTADFERTTLNITDDEKTFVRIETKTGETTVVRYQYDNHLGSACLELDDTGDIISYEEYHPFGTTSYRSGRTEIEVSLKRYKYCGKERDKETGLYYYGMRYYAAWLCRFISVDPLQFKYPYYTPYQYAGNKPISFIDLDGGEEEIPQQDIQQTINESTIVNEYIENGTTFKSVESSLQYELHTSDSTSELRYTYSSSLQELYQFSAPTNTWELVSSDRTTASFLEVNNYDNYNFGYPSASNDYMLYGNPSISAIESTLEIADKLNLIFESAGNSLENNAGKTQIGSNNKLYFENPSGRVFQGNQHVSTRSLSTIGSKISKVTGPIGYVIGAAEIGYGVYQDNWTYGYNAQKQTAGVIGGIAGGWAGAKIGAAMGGFIGSFFGGAGAGPGFVIGGIVGGVIGGVIGGWKGAEKAEEIFEQFYKQF
jgi:RHS repeat-associated protein